MILNEDQVKLILNKEVLETSEVCELLEYYIWDLKKVQVSILEPINRLQVQLMINFRDHVISYYLKKFNTNGINL